jgi:hypothetical protein
MSVKPRINEALDGLNTRTFKDIEIEGKKAYITNQEYFCEATAKRSLVKLSLERSVCKYAQ